MTRFARHAGGRRCLQRVDRNTADLDAGRYRFAPRRRAGDGAANDGEAFAGAPTAITSARQRDTLSRSAPTAWSALRWATRPRPCRPGGGGTRALFGTNPIAAV